jgi:hypothetical protein
VNLVKLFRRLALLAALAAGCGPEGGQMGPDDPGKRGAGATVLFMLRAGSDVDRLPARAGELTVDSVALWIDQLSLAGDRGGDHEGRDEIEGKLLDLTGGPVAFELPDVAPALYSRIRVDFGRVGEHAQVPIFEGMPLSFRVSGQTAAGLPFVLRGSDEFDVDLRMVDGAELGARTRLVCVVRFDMTGWFEGVDPGLESQERFVANLVHSASLSLSAVNRE